MREQNDFKILSLGTFNHVIAFNICESKFVRAAIKEKLINELPNLKNRKMIKEDVLNEARTIIAGFLKNRRIDLKLSQQDLADKVGIARETINRMESARIWIGMKPYLQLCDALNMSSGVAEMDSVTEIAAALRKNLKPNERKLFKKLIHT